MIELWDGQTDLRPLAEAWVAECVSGDYDIDKGMRDLQNLFKCEDSDVFVLKSYQVIGAMGIQIVDTPYEDVKYSAVRYWYVLPEFRFMAKMLVDYARKWSLDKGCSKILMSNSTRTIDASAFYKAIGLREHETIFIGDL